MLMQKEQKLQRGQNFLENWRAISKRKHYSKNHFVSLWVDIKLTEASLMAQMVKCLSSIWETQVQSLGWEDPGEGNSNPLKYYCLENPMDRGAWQATVHGVAKSRTQIWQINIKSFRLRMVQIQPDSLNIKEQHYFLKFNITGKIRT